MGAENEDKHETSEKGLFSSFGSGFGAGHGGQYVKPCPPQGYGYPPQPQQTQYSSYSYSSSGGNSPTGYPSSGGCQQASYAGGYPPAGGYSSGLTTSYHSAGNGITFVINIFIL